MLLEIDNSHVALLNIFDAEFSGIWSAIFLLIEITKLFDFFLKLIYLRIVPGNFQNDILFEFLFWLTLQTFFIFVAKDSFEFCFKLFLITFRFNFCHFVVFFSSFLLSFGGLQNLIPFVVKDFGEGQNIVMAHFLYRLNILLLPNVSISWLLMWRWGDRLLKHQAWHVWCHWLLGWAAHWHLHHILMLGCRLFETFNIFENGLVNWFVGHHELLQVNLLVGWSVELMFSTKIWLHFFL